MPEVAVWDCIHASDGQEGGVGSVCARSHLAAAILRPKKGGAAALTGGHTGPRPPSCVARSAEYHQKVYYDPYDRSSPLGSDIIGTRATRAVAKTALGTARKRLVANLHEATCVRSFENSTG